MLLSLEWTTVQLWIWMKNFMDAIPYDAVQASGIIFATTSEMSGIEQQNEKSAITHTYKMTVCQAK